MLVSWGFSLIRAMVLNQPCLFLLIFWSASLETKGISFNVDCEDIRDRAKADSFTKLFALVQAGSLVLQSIARKATGLQITELELMTMAFTLCALATYILWWHKPFDAERAIVLECPQAKQSEIRTMLATPRNNNIAVEDLDSDTLFMILFDIADLVEGTDDPERKYGIYYSGALYASGAAFSAVHLAAYNWTFPYPVVQTLWRIFSLVALGSSLLPLFVNVGFLSITLIPNLDKIINEDSILSVAVYAVGAMLLVNVLSRLALIGLTFYCLSSMPVSVYSDLVWIRFLPHFS
jgi:hypothetical protein